MIHEVKGFNSRDKQARPEIQLAILEQCEKSKASGTYGECCYLNVSTDNNYVTDKKDDHLKFHREASKHLMQSERNAPGT
ncbi:hypothetical protein Y1Q_0021559 [Alligator mississippiensis]|uniref:Uncharacterized protein n=1 Tax=Alligator mississippiensis TaxID=8496 RepID=A0A151PA34_ALLMI|nr:hypothetical protein Y1Q_0021559 [Alligator mississippiensis]